MLDQATLRDEVESLTGLHVLATKQLAAGNSRATYIVTVDDDDGSYELVVRHDTGGGPLSHTAFGLDREAAVYGAFGGRGLPVPALHACSEDHRTIVIDKVEGSDAWDIAMLPPLLEVLRRLHEADITNLVPHLAAASAWDDVAEWIHVHRSKTQPPSPYVELAQKVLADTFPGEPPHLVLCHGDVGPHNFLHRDGHLTGLIDWEFAHLGDPYDDLAWLTVRSWMFGLELPDFYPTATESYFGSADSLDLDRLRYWQAVVLLRNLVIVESAIAGGGTAAQDSLVHHILRPSLRWKLVEALAFLTPGIDVADLREAPPTPGHEGGEAVAEVCAGLDTLLSSSTLEAAQVRRVKLMRKLLRDLTSGWPQPAAPSLHGLSGVGLHRSLGDLAQHARAGLKAFPSAQRLADRPLAPFDQESADTEC